MNGETSFISDPSGFGTFNVLQGQAFEVPAAPRLVSVLIPCCGQLEYTKFCVSSLLAHCRSPYELVFLDIGSLDGTAEYLAGLAAAASVRLEVIQAATDASIPAVCQEALSRACGDYIVLLNNDTIVTNSWLDQLVALAEVSSQVGLVGPMSNCAAAPQLVESVPYRIASGNRGTKPVGSSQLAVGSRELAVGSRQAAEGGDQVSRNSRQDAMRFLSVDHRSIIAANLSVVDQFARQWREQNRGKWLEVDYLGGFCLLIKRIVLEQLGPLPTPSGLSVFDTDLVCQQARKAGYLLACCKDLFIHHFGSKTFAHGAPG